MKKNNTNSGFWFAYIETLTGLATIFLVLFLAATSQERKITKQNESLLNSWKEANNKLITLNAAPVPDSLMGGMRITLTDKLFFSLGSPKLTNQGNDKIKEISKVIADFYCTNSLFRSQMRIKIGGHTDKLGGDDVNFPLSYQRAQNISRIMQEVFYKSDLKKSIITPIAYGSKYPLPGHTNEIEPMNRRITIVLELISTKLL